MEILGASPEMLVVKMYEGALRYARLARQHHQAGRVGDRGIAISRALAIVQELVQAHGGDVSVRSDATAGTTFTVRLPRNGPPETAPPQPHRAAAPLGGRRWVT